VGVDGLQVEVLGLDSLPGNGPTALAVGPVRQQPEKVVEPVQGERGPLPDLDVREVVTLQR